MHKPLEIRIIDRLFARFEGRWMNQWTDKFRGIDVANVKAEWAEDLAGFADHLEALRYAFDVVKDGKFPPNLPEFKEAARRAPVKEAPALPYKPTAEDEAKAKASIAAAANALKPKFHDGIDRHWATHPRSEMQLRFIFQAAGNDSRFMPCIAEMVADGICTEDGHLLKMYRNGAWSKL